MSAENDVTEIASELRELAAELLKKADRLDAAAKAAARPTEPLTPTDSDDEAAARLIALEAAASGRDRTEVVEQLKRDFPGVDAESLVARFYS